MLTESTFLQDKNNVFVQVTTLWQPLWLWLLLNWSKIEFLHLFLFPASHLIPCWMTLLSEQMICTHLKMVTNYILCHSRITHVVSSVMRKKLNVLSQGTPTKHANQCTWSKQALCKLPIIKNILHTCVCGHAFVCVFACGCSLDDKAHPHHPLEERLLRETDYANRQRGDVRLDMLKMSHVSHSDEITISWSLVMLTVHGLYDRNKRFLYLLIVRCDWQVSNSAVF